MSTNVQMATPEQIPDLPGTEKQQFGGPGKPAHGIPRFEMRARRKADGTYENVEYVKILTPGDNKACPEHKVTDELREKYKPWYEHWRKGLEEAPSGTPLEMWPVLTPAQVHELKAINIFTVEQLAGVSDSNLHRIPMGRTLKNKAIAWLKAKGDADAVESQRRENEVLKDGMRSLEEQVSALSAQLQQKQAEAAPSNSETDAEESRGPGRPKGSKNKPKEGV